MASVVRTRHGLFGLFGILCFFSALTIGATSIYTTPKVLAKCGQNLTLRCDVVSTQALEIKEFFWMEKKDICQWGKTANVSDMSCNSTSSGNVYNFSLTIFNVMPLHKGTYHCKLRAKQGVENDKTIVRVQKCVGKSDSSVTPTEAKCTFNDVYPSATVLWTQGKVNITQSSLTKVEEDALGRYIITSVVKLDPSNKEPYNCSLWMPIENANNETVVQMVRALAFSGGYMVNPHWVCMVLVMLLVMLMV